jgi:hypothetical protein
MIKEIYKVKIQKLIKDLHFLTTYTTNAQQIIEEHKKSISIITEEMEDLSITNEITPQEKAILMDDRLNKIQEIGLKVIIIYNEISEKHEKIEDDKNVLISTFVEANPELSKSDILSEIEKEMKKLL